MVNRRHLANRTASKALAETSDVKDLARVKEAWRTKNEALEEIAQRTTELGEQISERKRAEEAL